MNTAFPFAETDVRAFFTKFPLPGVDYDALLSAQQKQVAAWQEIGGIAGGGFQALAARQVAMFQKGVDAALANAHAFAKVETPETGLQQQTDYVRASVETQLQNLGELGTIAQQTGAEVAEAVNKSFLASAEAWREAVIPAEAAAAPTAEAAAAPTAAPTAQAPKSKAK